MERLMVRSTTAGVWVLAAVLGCEPSEKATPTADEVASPVPANSMVQPEKASATADEVDSSVQASSLARLDVKVFYRERVALPPTSTLHVILEDGAKMDVAAEEVTEVEVPIEAGPPYDVPLEYDPALMSPQGRYGVRARIENEGKLLFASTQFNPAFGADGSLASPANDPVEVLVSRVPSSPKPSMASLTDTRWVLQRLNGKPAGPGAGGKAAVIMLQGSESRAAGFAGCNRFTGGYIVGAGELSFENMAMTKRLCSEGMGLERDFSRALTVTRSYRIDGGTLSLIDQNGTVVAVFEAG